MDRIKRCNDELKADRPTMEEVKFIPRLPISILVENVRSGTPISKSILNVRKKDFGALNPHVNKLANQIALGIPIQTAFETFGRDLNSQTISRAITIISESEKAGGQIETILDSVVKSVSQIEKLRKERRSAIYNLVVQGYIIFFIFIIIILIMEFKILIQILVNHLSIFSFKIYKLDTTSHRRCICLLFY